MRVQVCTDNIFFFPGEPNFTCPNTEEFLLKFLRARKFNVDQAFLLVRFYAHYFYIWNFPIFQNNCLPNEITKTKISPLVRQLWKITNLSTSRPDSHFTKKITSVWTRIESTRWEATRNIWSWRRENLGKQICFMYPNSVLTYAHRIRKCVFSSFSFSQLK